MNQHKVLSQLSFYSGTFREHNKLECFTFSTRCSLSVQSQFLIVLRNVIHRTGPGNESETKQILHKFHNRFRWLVKDFYHLNGNWYWHIFVGLFERAAPISASDFAQKIQIKQVLWFKEKNIWMFFQQKKCLSLFDIFIEVLRNLSWPWMWEYCKGTIDVHDIMTSSMWDLLNFEQKVQIVICVPFVLVMCTV